MSLKMHCSSGDGRLEAHLCTLHLRARCHLIGNGTSGIALALQALGVCGGNVAIPTNVCPNVPMAVYFSGNKPVYLDIDRETLGLSMVALQQCQFTLDAVIGVHAYGSVCSMDKLAAYCASRGIPLIEDAAVAQGAICGSRPVGSMGDVSILSFGAGKIIDIGHGGAILTNDGDLSRELARLISDLPISERCDYEEIARFGTYHTRLYNTHYATGEWSFAPEFKKRALLLRESVLTRFDDTYREILKGKLESLGVNIKRREDKAHWAAEMLSRERTDWMKVHLPAKGSVYWRLNLLFSQRRDLILKTILNQSMPISSWFPPVEPFFEGVRSESIPTPVANQIGAQILNVWVNEQVDDDYYQRLSQAISEV